MGHSAKKGNSGLQPRGDIQLMRQCLSHAPVGMQGSGMTDLKLPDDMAIN